jgi:ribosome-associated protein
MDIRKLQKAVITALQDIKAVDIKACDVKHLTSMFDRVVIATANSARQAKSLARSVHDKARELGVRVYGLEGDDTGEWVLVDLGDIVVHIMLPAVRAHYNLEELWNQPKPRAQRKLAAPPHASAKSK